MYMFFCDWLGKFWHLYYFTLYDANARKINKREMLKNAFMIIVKMKVFMGKWKKKINILIAFSFSQKIV